MISTLDTLSIKQVLYSRNPLDIKGKVSLQRLHLDRVDHVCGISEAGQVRGRGGGEPLHNLELDIVRNNIMEGKQNSAGIFAPTPCNLHFS